MKTKRFLVSTAAMLVMLAIIGSGFSYWFFETNIVEKEQTLGTAEVAQLVEVGTITVADNFSFAFDQTDDGRRDNGNNVNLGASDKHTGITLKLGSNTKAVYEKDTTVENAPYTFTVTVTIKKSLAAYFNIESNDANWTVARNDSDENVTTIVFTSTNATEFDWASDVKLSYIVNGVNKEPTNKSEYEAFANEVATGTITVKYKAELATN